MASFLDKFSVPTAVDETSKMDLSCQHITTADFMQLNPIYTKEMVPNEKLAVNTQTFTRMAAMPVPTFGRANVHERAFFVPYRTVWKGWTDFITDTVHVAADQTSAIASKPPVFTMEALVKAMITPNTLPFPLYNVGSNAGFRVFTSQEAEDEQLDFDDYDLVTPLGYANSLGITSIGGITVGSADGVAFKFNAVGRQALKILNSLGYQLVISDDPAYGWQGFEMSALPLLAFFKVYIDWYFPSQYYDDLYRTLIEGILNRDTTGTFSITAEQLSSIFGLIAYVNYDSDYFVSAFDNPEGPNNGQASLVNISDITNGAGQSSTAATATIRNANRQVTSSPNPTNGWIAPNTPAAYGFAQSGTAGSGNLNSLTQYTLTALKKLTDYMKRHQLVGARAMDRYLARFGKNLTAEKLNRSLYIGAKSFPLQIGDIMSQADTTGANLGAYAGKGLGYGENTFGYETDEYGLFIITCSIVPTVGYYQGIDRNVLHLSKLDYWTPEFDQLGNQAIGSAELYVPTKPSQYIDNSGQSDGGILDGLSTQIFGYAPRYAEYKCGRDRLTGDYRLSRFNQAGDTTNSWHLFREFDNEDWQGEARTIQHSLDFVKGIDGNQFNRIFYNTDSTADHFYMIHNFDVASYSNMAKLYDTYEFDDKGKKITEEVNGVKVN